MHKHVAFGMELRRLFHTFHGLNLRQDFVQKATLIEQFKGMARMAFGQHASKFVADPLARDLVDLRRQLLNRGKRRGLDRVLESGSETNSA